MAPVVDLVCSLVHDDPISDHEGVRSERQAARFINACIKVTILTNLHQGMMDHLIVHFLLSVGHLTPQDGSKAI